jgi:hypothetical protein
MYLCTYLITSVRVLSLLTFPLISGVIYFKNPRKPSTSTKLVIGDEMPFFKEQVFHFSALPPSSVFFEARLTNEALSSCIFKTDRALKVAPVRYIYVCKQSTGFMILTDPIIVWAILIAGTPEVRNSCSGIGIFFELPIECRI